jgi:TfoX/Sxy family transcriptional regulator of competence genes
MAWVKIPKENHEVFYARLPRDKRIKTLQMFGAAAAKVNGHLFGGLFAKSFMVKLGDTDHATALALDGAERFDPMGNGRVMSNSVLMPESLMDEADEMTAWLQKALDYTLTLPPKAVKPAKKSAPLAQPSEPASAAKKSAPKKSAAKPAATKKSAAKPAATKKSAPKPAATKKSAKATVKTKAKAKTTLKTKAKAKTTLKTKAKAKTT